MGRRSTGTVRILRNDQGRLQWHAKWTRADGSRTDWTELDPLIPLDDEAKAKACAARMAPKVKRASAIGSAVETVGEYADRWCDWRKAKGLGCVQDDRTLLSHHILPTIGSLDVRTIGNAALRSLVAELDTRVAHGEFSWKSAVNVWSVVRALFRDACRAKQDDLRVRGDNPSHDVAGPDVGVRKAKTYLWPSEFLKLVSCDGVPLRWRRLFALAVYMYARAGEIDALEWADVDLEHETLHIHRSCDRRRGIGMKATKSDAARRIPIEPELLPLLRAMHWEAKGKGPVLRLPGDGGPAKLRMYLARAGVARADLFTTDATRKAITVHDLRATGITWCAVRGDDPLKIMQRAGHADFETTKIYLREAENLSQGFGTVFPVLPKSLLGIAPKSPRAILFSRTSQKQGDLCGPSGTRTRTPFRVADFKSAAYTDSAKGPIASRSHPGGQPRSGYTHLMVSRSSRRITSL